MSSSIWIADELFKLMGVYRIPKKKGHRIFRANFTKKLKEEKT
jgi:hypothetical protein